MWHAGLEECRTGGPLKQEGFRTGGMYIVYYRSDTGLEGRRTGGMQDRSDAGKKGCKEMRVPGMEGLRKGGIKERRD